MTTTPSVIQSPAATASASGDGGGTLVPQQHRAGRRGTGQWSSPLVLRAARAAAVSVVMIWAVILGGHAWWSHDSISTATRDSDQFVRTHTAMATVLEAQAVVANGAVTRVAKLGTPGSWAEPLAGAQRSLVEAAAAQPSDARALADVQRPLIEWANKASAADIAPADSAPTAVAKADRVMTTSIEPAMAEVVATNAARVRDHGAVAVPWLPTALGSAALVVLLVCAVALARRTHRVINPALTLSVMVVLGATMWGQGLMNGASQRVDQARNHSSARIVAATAARAELMSARAAESLSVLKRSADGSRWDRHATAVTDHIDTLRTLGSRSPSVESLESTHRAVVKDLVSAKSWTTAARSSAVGDSHTAQQQLDSALAAEVERAALEERNAFTAASTQSWWALLVFGFSGALAAALAWWGINRRLREYR